MFDYAKNLPADLRLVITEEMDEDEAKKNLREFQRMAKEREKEEERARKPEKEKKGIFGGLFRKKDR